MAIRTKRATSIRSGLDGITAMSTAMSTAKAIKTERVERTRKIKTKSSVRTKELKQTLLFDK